MNALAMSFAWAGLVLAMLGLSAASEAAEIRVLCSVGMQPATPQIIAEFERATGHTVKVTYGLAAVLKTKFLEGEPAGVLILTAPIIEDLAKQGKVAVGSKVDIARSGVGVAVKAGAPKPDIGTADALKSALLSAKSIGFSREGASGVAFARAVERLGISEQVKAKYRDTGTKAGEMVAAGEIEVAAAQIPELLAVPGVDVIGPLPVDLQTVTIFSAGLAATAKQPDAAKALIQFLAGPAAAPVYKAKGLAG
jgi:molybdate transport system substrate-binding protein